MLYMYSNSMNEYDIYLPNNIKNTQNLCYLNKANFDHYFIYFFHEITTKQKMCMCTKYVRAYNCASYSGLLISVR